MFNVLRDVPAVTKIAQVAVRDFSEREAALAASSGRVVLFDDLSLAAAGFRGETWDAQCLRIVETLPQEVYVSFDIDGLSYENCPHTGTRAFGPPHRRVRRGGGHSGPRGADRRHNGRTGIVEVV